MPARAVSLGIMCPAPLHPLCRGCQLLQPTGELDRRWVELQGGIAQHWSDSPWDPMPLCFPKRTGSQKQHDQKALCPPVSSSQQVRRVIRKARRRLPLRHDACLAGMPGDSIGRDLHGSATAAIEQIEVVSPSSSQLTSAIEDVKPPDDFVEPPL